MIFIEGSSFRMGSERFYPEERPVRDARAESFWMDETPVTNAAFARFVEKTGYVTLAEAAAVGLPYAGSSVFKRPATAVNLSDPSQWWEFVEGACWRRPLGRDSGIEGLEDHPVVHIAYEDALAYAAWAGKQLPTEAEWELAARAGLDGADYAWGTDLAPGGEMLANYWQGNFPHENTLLDGWERTSPVGAFPGNAFGLLDMIGNVWEWTADAWMLPGGAAAGKPTCCGAAQGRAVAVPQKVLKGGSHLCALNYCQRYRPAARHPQPVDSPASHIGFRCVIR